MRIQQLLISLAFFLIAADTSAQSTCSFDETYRKAIQADPLFAAQVTLVNREIQDRIISRRSQPGIGKKTSATVYTIPVVIHVMHTGGAIGSTYNPTDAQIEATIDYLNRVYAGTWPGMKPQLGATSVTDIEIRFALAQRAPGCGYTNGIDRVDASSIPNYVQYGVNANNSNGVSEIDLKNFSRWDPSKYYNVWLVNKIDGADGTSGQFIGGYAYFAGAPASLDGTIMLSTQIFAGNKVLPHEIGHALGVYHTFNGSANSTQCPSNGNCMAEGDYVCDTDPVTNNVTGGVYSFACRTGNNDCLNPSATNYSINTEENFMAYTNCANLFTEGQKERMQAAMTLPSRSSLVDAGNMALVPCGAEINFSQSGANISESNTNGSLDCRLYKDYIYEVVTGAAPSADATVSFTLGGNATRGLDYDFTTNGDFINGSDDLIFASGSTTPQQIFIRVYDDASVETVENLVIDFTVNNGGGNGTKGTTIPTFTLQMSDNDLAPVASLTGTFSLGSHASNGSGAPYDATLTRQRTQVLYKASELQGIGLTAGNIQSLAFNISQKNSTRAFSNFTIKVGAAGINNLVDGSVTYFTGLTTVYSAATHTTALGWNTYDFSAPFVWNGTSGIVVEICYDNGSANASAGKDMVALYADGSGSTQGNIIFQEINCASNFTSVGYYSNGWKPITRWGIAIAGTEVETQLGASGAIHVGDNDNEYLYSNNSRIMAQLQGTTSNLDCVDASLGGAGNSWIAFSGGQRSSKAITLTPALNGSTTNYTVSLYFANEELNGMDVNDLRLAKTSAASIDAANSSNTVIVTPVVTTLGSDITIFTGNFTGFSTFFLTTNTVTLPVSLLRFTGKLLAGNDVVLDWQTGFEQNNYGFDIERSNNNIQFEKIATILSKGDTRLGYSYQYVDKSVGTGTYYYRLKQRDRDGTFKYSETETIKINNNSGLTILPVPATDFATIRFTPTTGYHYTIQLMTITGQKIVDYKVPSGTSTYAIDVRKIQPGIYLVRTEGNGKVEVLRLVKQ